MENQHRFELEQEVIEWLLGKEGAAEEYESLLSELFRITGETREEIERRCIETENGNNTTQTGI